MFASKAVENLQKRIQAVENLNFDQGFELIHDEIKQSAHTIQKDLKIFTESSDKLLFLMKKNVRISLDIISQVVSFPKIHEMNILNQGNAITTKERVDKLYHFPQNFWQ